MQKMKTETLVYYGLISLTSSVIIGIGYFCWILLKKAGLL